jgi:hypothetical protein
MLAITVKTPTGRRQGVTLFAAAPALPLHSAGKYVAGAYIVFVALILIYVAIMATRLSRNERDIAELMRDLNARREEHDDDHTPEREPVGAGRLTPPPEGEPGWRAGA